MTGRPQAARRHSWIRPPQHFDPLHGDSPLEFRSFGGWFGGRVTVVWMVSVLGVGSGVEDEGVVDAFFWGAGAGSEGCGEFGFGVALVAGEVDADVPAVDGALVAQPQDGCGLAVAG